MKSNWSKRPSVRPAQFDSATQHRRAMTGKIKLAQKEIGLSDDDYRAVLFRVTGKISSTACSEAMLSLMLDELKRLGWKAKPKKAVSRVADHPAAKKARALWISLHHLGAFDDPSEAGLETFGRRQLGCTALQWADQGQMYKLIEALKAIGTRHGWDQELTGVERGETAIRVLKIRLCQAILNKLKEKGLAAERWNLAGAAVQLCGFDKGRAYGPMAWDPGEVDGIAKAFGEMLRHGKRKEA